MSFYRRFSPWQYKDWPSYLGRDGEEFVKAVIQNREIWQTEEQRDRLNRVCWDCPDPQHDMEAPNEFRSAEKYYREKFPELFAEKPADPLHAELASLKERLSGVENALGQLAQRRGIIF
jgi:hypothetical protein